METVLSLQIGGMTCAACVGRVEKVLRRVPGVDAAAVNLMTGRASVQAASQVTFASLVAAVEKAGYQASPVVPDRAPEAASWWPVILGAVLCGPLVAPMLLMPLGVMVMLPGWLQAGLAGLVQAGLGWRFYVAGFKSVRGGAASMDVLVAVGTSAAFAVSLYALWSGTGALYFEASSVVITLVLLGRRLEAQARRETGAAIRALAQLRPETARVLQDDREVETAVASVPIGALVVVRPGERFAVDGVVIEGAGSADESLLTGESLPVTKAPGDSVMAGAINGASRLVLRSTAAAGETVLSRMVRLVEAAQAAKPAVQRLADRVSAVFVPAVLGIAAVTLVGWLWAGAGAEAAILNAVSVLVIACPCALGLAAPAAIMAGTGVAARHGILIRDPAMLDRARAVDMVVFDKTGTLTMGRPAVVACHGGDRSEILRLAAALQAGSAHPLAGAVLAAAPGVAPAQDIRDLPGRGVEGVVDGVSLVLGSQRLLDENGLVPAELADAAAELAAAGHTLAWLIETAPDRRVRGLIGFADPLKPQAAAAIAGLQARGLQTLLLSGDNAGSVAAAARELGIDAWAAGMLPADKLAKLAALHAQGRIIAMVGDGINDAPALAAADIGMAMATGTDVAMQAAAITLMRGDPSLAAAALDIARLTDARVRQGLVWAFVFNAIGIPLAAAGLLTPIFAGAAMAFSSVAVVANALSLRRWRPA